VAGRGRVHVQSRPEVPRQGSDDGPVGEARAEAGLGQQAGRRHAGAVDEQADERALGPGEPEVRRRRG
jgi:hypothetical protein